ncbi:MAG: STAS domain-containing protein [Actinomycetales bacterium]
MSVGTEVGLEITARRVDDAVVISVIGEIDAFTAGSLREHLLNLVARESTRVVLDLAAVTFLDSAGINVLVSLRRRLLLLDGYLRLASLRPAPARVLEVCGLDRVFECYPDVATALAAAPATRGAEAAHVRPPRVTVRQ